MAKRVVYVISKTGTIRWVWERSREQPLPDYDLVLAEAKKVAQESN
jgi:peroxiredoxin